MAEICAISSQDNKGVNVESTGGLGGYPPVENLRMLGIEWQESVLF